MVTASSVVEMTVTTRHLVIGGGERTPAVVIDEVRPSVRPSVCDTV